MKKDISLRAHQLMKDYFEAIYTLIYFFPYFFSLIPLLQTLFAPWKHIVTKKEIRGFDFSEYFNRLLLNIMSSLIGASMRFSIISFCIFFEVFYILSLPVITLLYFLIMLPIQLLRYYLSPTEEEKKELEKEAFLKTHCLKQENSVVVTEWFEEMWGKQNETKKG